MILKLILQFISIEIFNIQKGDKYAYNDDRDFIVFNPAS